ncbi:sigma-70 family RNA polymerase sigma factor [Streptomyces sp. SCUT-3]|uniref:RNA polymerase sigma factor SigJ n=1 Tax=Streptomyces sp. SCUT-3 TaxID=2684469 RepID=UPI0015FC7385|nr:RNA polymerase sigma factor SigJ [Streptomyces sp. SCUT-3]QMV25361.1 sigma-70 family RNA polymerase sigma factor [Streptomyces sp. SCUT-3]
MASAAVQDPVEAFEAQRRRLGAVAYRLLGSVADAEDVLQEAWLRWQAADRTRVEDVRAYLTTVVTRLAYDLLGSARVRRESYHGEWLPEPLVADADRADSPDERAELGESVSLALLAVMEQLTPAERVAFVLHDLFSVGFPEVAAVLDRTPEATRQLASRARRKVRDGGHRGAVDPAEHRRAVRAFTAAAAGGDVRGLLAVLAPDVVWHADGGGVVSAAARPVLGAEKVARLVAGLVARLVAGRTGTATGPATGPAAGPAAGVAVEAVVVPARVNGEPGLVWYSAPGRIGGVIAFTVADGRITRVDAVVNPEKLTHLA